MGGIKPYHGTREAYKGGDTHQGVSGRLEWHFLLKREAKLGINLPKTMRKGVKTGHKPP